MRVLVAVDIFDPTHAALVEEAGVWGTRLGATVDLGYIDGMSYVRPAILDQRLRNVLDVEMKRLSADRQEQLVALVSTLPKAVRGTARYRYDYPATDAFISMCEGYDLVIVGTHGRQGVARLLLGSFAERVVRDAPTATLVVRLVKED